jgi:hypothetical protein
MFGYTPSTAINCMALVSFYEGFMWIKLCPIACHVWITKTAPWGVWGHLTTQPRRIWVYLLVPTIPWKNFCVFFSQTSVKSKQKIGEYLMHKPANGNGKIINFPKKQDSIGIQDLSEQIEHLMEFFEAQGVMIVLKKGDGFVVSGADLSSEDFVKIADAVTDMATS